jgi:hypothetical protein
MAGFLEKYTKLSTYNPSVISKVEGGNSGWNGSTICPVNRQGSKKLAFNPIWLRTELIFCVPVTWVTPEAVEHLFQKPVFVLCGIWITDRQFEYCNLVVRKNTLAECFFQSPWCSVRCFWTTMFTIRCMLSGQSTSAYFLDLDQNLSS